ncbi:cobalamin B12-binding domain-containing protein [Aquibacillus koreensis]|uniref:Cobalamin B12-binding domain-containing protein n=1 Tax=Aquibacillus koreensis TaxID=279446 RepID=A0A9X3WLU4_9BACI|nr:cobalamin B12-binding domain-containing protein [Aquibacillus koreensis]MCT2536135.1 cobalamin B12-binding domain-containing protein [Aquibacillus koreensis]MDC3422060.1 cobalamin B12-binding domain-containing protein [Aquibacillus koreensis]
MYGIKKVTEITGIPPITLRAWENRYDVIKPSRTDGGTRVYSQENVDDLLWVIAQREEKSISIKQAMKLLKEEKEKKDPFIHVTFDDSDGSYESYVHDIYHALVNYDTNRATHLINLAFSTLDYEVVFHEIFVPILHQVGDQWQEGKLSVAQEHFISHFIQRRLFSFFQEISSDVNKAKALAICPPLELHNIGLILFSLFLKRRGVDVIFVGENTPKENLIPIIQANNIRLICFSITIEEHIDHLESFINYVQSYPLDLDFLIGGNAVDKLPDKYKSHILTGDLNNWKKWFEETDLF